MEPRFVDIHSHVVPSGDDGAQSVSEGLSLGRDAFEHGTRVLYATPHVGPHVPPFDESRERRIRTAFRELCERLPLELRLGFELTPMPSLLGDDPWRFVLEGTELVGLTPIVAHPERTEAVLTDPGLADELAERGWPLQLNATSLLGYHSPEMEREGWRLIDEGLASFVASDGHRATRPMLLDGAYELVMGRRGEEAALRLFDGSALSVTAAKAPQPPSHAASPGA